MYVSMTVSVSLRSLRNIESNFQSLNSFTSTCVTFQPVVHLKVTKTEERIDMERLKAREQIMFFDEILLFEDELHDHGVSMISVKIVSAVFMLKKLMILIQMSIRVTII